MDKSQQNNDPNLSQVLLNKSLLALLLLALVTASFLAMNALSESSVAGRGWSIAATVALFILVFVISQMGYRVYYSSTAKTRQVAATKTFTVESERGLKIRTLIVLVSMSTLTLYSLYILYSPSTMTVSATGRVLILIFMASLLPLIVIAMLPVVCNKVSVSDTQVELLSFVKGRRSIPLSAIQDVHVKQSLDAKFSLDSKGDTLIIGWLSESGALVEDSIKLHLQMANRDLLFALLKKRVVG